MTAKKAKKKSKRKVVAKKRPRSKTSSGSTRTAAKKTAGKKSPRSKKSSKRTPATAKRAGKSTKSSSRSKPKTTTKRRRKGQAAASLFLQKHREQKISPDDFADRMQLTEAEVRVLEAIACGMKVRNAQSVIKAIEMKMKWIYSQPAKKKEHKVTGTLVIVDKIPRGPNDPLPGEEGESNAEERDGSDAK